MISGAMSYGPTRTATAGAVAMGLCLPMGGCGFLSAGDDGLTERTPDYVTSAGAQIHDFEPDFAVQLTSAPSAEAYWCAAAEYLARTSPQATALRRQTGEFNGPIQEHPDQGLVVVPGRVVYFIDGGRIGDWDDRTKLDTFSEDTSLFGGRIREIRRVADITPACAAAQA